MRPGAIGRIKCGLEMVDHPVIDEAFQGIIDAIIKEEVLSEKELADILLVSVPSISRCQI